MTVAVDPLTLTERVIRAVEEAVAAATPGSRVGSVQSFSAAAGGASTYVTVEAIKAARARGVDVWALRGADGGYRAGPPEAIAAQLAPATAARFLARVAEQQLPGHRGQRSSPSGADVLARRVPDLNAGTSSGQDPVNQDPVESLPAARDGSVEDAGVPDVGMRIDLGTEASVHRAGPDLLIVRVPPTMRVLVERTDPGD